MKDQSTLHISPGRRAASYWFVDGFPEILFGITLGVAAAAGVVWRLYAPVPAREFYLPVVAAWALLYFYKERAILNYLKSRFTYPRTGYVQPPEETEAGVKRCSLISLDLSPKPKPPANENVTFFRQRTVMLVGWVFYPFLLNGNTSGRWLGIGMMPVLAAALFMSNRKSEHRYPWWSLVVLALTGTLFFAIDVPVIVEPLVLLLFAAAWFVAQGLATLVAYLRANPYRAVEGVGA
jgi:hypothetical protein